MTASDPPEPSASLLAWAGRVHGRSLAGWITWTAGDAGPVLSPDLADRSGWDQHGTLWAEILPEAGPSVLQDLQAMEEGEPMLPLRLRCRDGRSLTLGAAAARDGSRHLAVLSPLKAADGELRQMRTDLITNLTHEIRTPMNAILGIAQVLEQTPLDLRQLEYIDILKQGAGDLLTLLNDLMDFSRLDGGQLPIAAISVELASVVHEAIRLWAPRAAGKQVAILLDWDEALPERVRLDTLRVRQILSNLLSNAIKFTEAGHVLIQVGADPARPWQEGLVNLQITVSDTGIGVPDDRAEAIFEAFVQADGSITRRHGGSGLGLAIARRLTALLGGSLSLQTPPGDRRGASFVLRLPVPVEPPVASPLARLDLSGMRLIAVAEDPTAYQILARVLARRGAACEALPDAAAALERLRSLGPEERALLLLGRRLPEGERSLLVQQQPSQSTGQVKRVQPVAPLRLGREAGAEAGVDLLLHDAWLPWELDRLLAPLWPQAVPDPVLHLAPETGQRPLEGLRLIIADDVALNRLVVAKALTVLGAEVVTVEHGEALLQALPGGSFDAALLDVAMPVMDGLQATRLIRAGEQIGRLPILGLTGHTHAEDRRRCLKAGMDAVLPKPLSMPGLVQAILDVTRRPMTSPQSQPLQSLEMGSGA